MVRASIPKRITEHSILSLVHSKTPLLSFEETKRFDFVGMKSLNDGNYRDALYKKLIAAKSYERRRRHFKDVFNAAMCYDRASNLAYLLGFKTVDFICAVRSVRLHSENLELYKDQASFEHKTSVKGLDFAIESIWNHFTYKLTTSVYPDNHIWFPHVQQDAA